LSIENGALRINLSILVSEKSAQLAFRGEIEENDGNVNELGDLNARRFSKSFQRYREEGWASQEVTLTLIRISSLLSL